MEEISGVEVDGVGTDLAAAERFRPGFPRLEAGPRLELGAGPGVARRHVLRRWGAGEDEGREEGEEKVRGAHGA